MLVLQLLTDQRIILRDRDTDAAIAVVAVTQIGRGKVRLGISAPDTVIADREAIDNAKQAARQRGGPSLPVPPVTVAETPYLQPADSRKRCNCGPLDMIESRSLRGRCDKCGHRINTHAPIVRPTLTLRSPQ